MRNKQLQVLHGIIIAACLVVALAADQSGSPPQGVFVSHDGAGVAPGELIVRFRHGVPDAQRKALLRPIEPLSVRTLSLDDFVLVTVKEAERDLIGRALARSDAVSSVEEVSVRYPAAIPNDPDYRLQWHLQAIGLTQAREIADGDGVTVAVLDTGVAFEDYVHPLTNITFGRAPDLIGTEFIDPHNAYSGGVHANDDMGHGTHVAGTIAQATDNNLATAGIAPRARIMPVKICGPQPIPGQAYGCRTTDIAEGINDAVNEGADIINLSIGGGGAITAPERAALANADAAGVVVIAAAGNSPDGIGKPFLDYPAAVPSVISVAAVGLAGQRAIYSNHGANELGLLMDLSAPGGDPANEGAPSFVFQQTYTSCLNNTQSFTTFAVTPCAGTSMAAAHVSGVAALIMSEFPDLGHTDVRQTLRQCALDLGAPGQDAQTGFGLVQAYESVRNVDGDGLPDCIDPDLTTSTPTPPPPECGAALLTPTLSATGTPAGTAGSSSTAEGGSPQLASEGDNSPTPTPSEGPSATTSPDESPNAPSNTAPPQTASPTPTPSPTPTSTPPPTPTPGPSLPKCGDTDCNGEVDPRDALGVMSYVAQITPYADCIGRGYVNCDGLLDIADAFTIMRFSADLPLNLPAGCPGVG